MKEQLPGFVLSELFSNSVVCVDEVMAPLVKDDLVKDIKLYLGDYKKKIVIITSDNNNMYVSDESLEFLSGILNACKLNLADIALINFNNTVVNFLQLKKEMQPEFLLLFGVTALQIELPFTLPDYQVQDYSNCKIVTAPLLTELNKQTQQAKTEKIKLWKSLQKMFNLEK
jgi:hypothetical protein